MRITSRVSISSSSVISAAAATSSSVGGRPCLAASSRSARAILRSRWPMWTGMRIVRPWLARPRWIAWRIQKVA